MLIKNRRSLRVSVVLLTTLIFCMFSYSRIMALEGNSNLVKKQDNSNIIKTNAQKNKKEVKVQNKVSKSKTKSNIAVNKNKDTVPTISKSSSNKKGNVISNLLVFPAVGTISSPFGYRVLKLQDGSVSKEIHSGIDIAAPMGSKISSALGGVVKFAGVVDGYGNTIIISHDNGMETLYGHCSKLEVKAGDKVEAKQEIGKVGSTGRSTGPHVHFEVRINGSAVNPMSYLDTSSITGN